MAKSKKKTEKRQENLFEVTIRYFAGLADTNTTLLIAVSQPADEPPSFEDAIENARGVIAAARRDEEDAYKNWRILRVEVCGVIANY